MNLKDLIMEVERLNKKLFGNKLYGCPVTKGQLKAIKQTVEAVEKQGITREDYEDWQKLKKLLGLK